MSSPSTSGKSSGRQQVFVLVGGTGDLAMRMLWPSLAMLDQDGFIDSGLRLISVAREKVDTATFRAPGWSKRCKSARRQGLEPRHGRTPRRPPDARRARRLGSREWGEKLKAELGDVDALDIVYFLSTSPTLFKPICEQLRIAGLSHAPNRVIIEKPIGRDLETSKVINDSVGHAFDEARTFRIDHYLGKETVQNLLALRFGNAIFEPLWTSRSIDHVQISVSETVGVGDQLGYYDEYGALRDMRAEPPVAAPVPPGHGSAGVAGVGRAA